MSPTREAPPASAINRARRRARPNSQRPHTNGPPPDLNSGGEDEAPDLPLVVHYEQFLGFMLQHGFIFMPTGQLWPASSVNARLPWKMVGPRRISPARWLNTHRPVEQMTWQPGEPQLVRDCFIVEGGWVSHRGARLFNLYKPPSITHGDLALATPWVDLVRRLWPDDAEHLFNCFAHRVQRPQEKINHALVIGGDPGIGKDSLLEGVIQAVGSHNVQDISPANLLGNFNGFAKSVILRISEARDLEYNRYQFYEHTKIYAAAPPEVLRVNGEYLREVYVPNLTQLVITTNYLTGGMYLPRDDRRHFVAWSQLEQEDFGATSRSARPSGTLFGSGTATAASVMSRPGWPSVNCRNSTPRHRHARPTPLGDSRLQRSA